MKKLILALLMLPSLSYSSDLNDANIANAKKIGTTIYYTCIMNIPNKIKCDALYENYKRFLRMVAAPTALSTSQEVFHYPSEYDVCKYDASHFVFNNPSSQPYCPTNF